MPRVAYEGFSLVLPPGWSEVLEEATYSDPDQLPPMSFAGPARVGAMYVSTPLFAREDQPGARPSDAEELALEYGQRRGVEQPLGLTTDSSPMGGAATAYFRMGDDFVQVWFVTNGRAVLQASYLCPWSARDSEREGREALVASLRFV